MDHRIVKNLAIQAGFVFDPLDCNFYAPEPEAWINKEIWKFAELILENKDLITKNDD